jgi:Methyltransferase domain
MSAMHSRDLRRRARKLIPEVPVIHHPGADRFSVIDPLPLHGNVGIELGVAAGSFSARMVASGRFARFYGVDAYADGHSAAEYKRALLAVGLWSEYRLLRLTFAQALDLFPDATFDFVYADGYAHTGEEGGQTLTDWYAKLRPGGVMAGDDYDPEAWPLVVGAVNHLADQVGAELQVTGLVTDAPYNRFPSWYFIKPETAPPVLTLHPEIAALAVAEKIRVAAERRAARLARRAAPKDTPTTGS